VATDYEPVTLAGPTCDSADVIARDYPMPALNVGDVVVSPLMGAYTSVTSSRFNGIPATPIVEV
jgi:ornithine decarboxylase